MPTSKSESRSEKESVESAIKQAVESNPCGMCRALGLPICKGHSGGHGDKKEGSVEKYQQGSAKSPDIAEANTLPSYLGGSEVWISDDDSKYSFTNELSIFSINLDLKNGMIHFKATEPLTADNKKDLEQLYTEITKEVKTEDIIFSREGNNLEIRLPSTESCEQFITKLLNKHLIPDNDYNTDITNAANQHVLKKIIKSGHVPAVGYACVEPKEKSEHAFVSTSSSVGKKAANDKINTVKKDTQFPASSLSKIVFTYLVLQWADENEIDLDEPLHNIIEKKQISLDRSLEHVLQYDRFMVEGKYPEQAKKLTIRHILSHTTGLPNVGGDPTSTLEFNSEPGEKYSYSGEAFYYLQQVIEAIEGKGLEDLAKQYVFEPIGMSSKTSFLPQAEDAPNIVKVHTEVGEAKDIYIGNPPVHAAGSLITTADDFSKFMAAWLKQMDEPAIKKGSSKKEPSIKQSFEPTSTESFPTCGLGWHIYRNGDQVIAYQYGQNLNTRAFVAIDVKHKKGAAFFTNSENGMSIADRVFDCPDLVPIGDLQAVYENLKYSQCDEPGWQETIEGKVAESKKEFKVARRFYQEALELSPDEKSKGQRKQHLEWFDELHPLSGEVQIFTEPPLETFKGHFSNKWKDLIEMDVKEKSLIFSQFGKETKLVRVSETDFLPENDQSMKVSINKDEMTIYYVNGDKKSLTRDSPKYEKDQRKRKKTVAKSNKVKEQIQARKRFREEQIGSNKPTTESKGVKPGSHT